MTGRRFSLRTLASRLRSDEKGIAATEFGLIAPVFLILIIGLFDMAHMTYAKTNFEGVVQSAARASSLETADTTAADLMVFNRMKPLMPGIQRSDLKTKRTSYYDFADIARPETLDDKNGNNQCDTGETYFDENRNGRWDKDIGSDGNGGAGDVVMYTATVTYKPPIKIPFMPAMWANRTLTATAVKKNQPFAQQTPYAATSKSC